MGKKRTFPRLKEKPTREAIELGSHLIDALGGTGAVCELMGYTDHTRVAHWRSNGIAPKRCAEMAALGGIDPALLRPDWFLPWPKDLDNVPAYGEPNWINPRRSRKRSNAA